MTQQNTKGWAFYNKPEDVEIYDVFTLQDGTRVIIEEIRKIKKQAVPEYIWEFIDRDSGRVCHFHEFSFKNI